jgi:hypothetical protein
VENILQKLKQACQEAKPDENAKLKDIILEPQTGECKFIWQEEEK